MWAEEERRAGRKGGLHWTGHQHKGSEENTDHARTSIDGEDTGRARVWAGSGNPADHCLATPTWRTRREKAADRSKNVKQRGGAARRLVRQRPG